MGETGGSGFVQGLVFGAGGTLLVGLAALYGLGSTGRTSTGFIAFDGAIAWIYTNLGLSLPVFGLLLALYLHGLRKLKRALAEDAAIERVAQYDHLVDIWTSLFFGVGVIWTAIGMRSALVYALGEPEVTLHLGAYAILERMVEGGILLALSTTIFGGVGGYLMRVFKALRVETELKRYYDRLARAPSTEIQETLRAIEGHLLTLTQQTLPTKDTHHGQAGLAHSAEPRRGYQ